MDHHLAYEIRCLCQDMDMLYRVWPEMNGATPSFLPEGTAYFEAALVHARNLTEFFVRPNGDPETLSPSDFGLRRFSYEDSSHRFQQNRARLGSPWRAKIVSTRLTVAADYSWAS